MTTHDNYFIGFFVLLNYSSELKTSLLQLMARHTTVCSLYSKSANISPRIAFERNFTHFFLASFSSSLGSGMILDCALPITSKGEPSINYIIKKFQDDLINLSPREP